jgi:diketogulonate reductase-like aldo/keto reductase
VAAIALAWVRQRPEVTSTLIGARTPEQLEANLASLDVTLTAEHIARLDALTAPSLDYPHTMIESMVGFQQGGTTINGLAAQAFVR